MSLNCGLCSRPWMAVALTACSCAAVDIEDLRAWLATAPTPGTMQVSTTQAAMADGSRSWSSDGTLVCPLGLIEVQGEATAGMEDLRRPPPAVEAGGYGRLSTSLGLRTWSSGGYAAGLETQATASGYGPPGNHPLTDLNAQAFVRMPLGDGRNAILAWARYETQRLLWQHAFLPGGGWMYDGDDLWLLLGFPLSAVAWKATPDIQVTAAVGDPWHVGVDREFSEAWTLGAAVDWRQDGYRRDGARGSDLVASEDLRTTLTLGWRPSAWCEFDVDAGWASHRRVRIVDAASGRSEAVSATAPGAFFGAGLYLYF